MPGSVGLYTPREEGDPTQGRAGQAAGRGAGGGLHLFCSDNEAAAVTPTADISHILPCLPQQL